MSNTNMQRLLDEYKQTELTARLMGEAIDNQSNRPSRESMQALDAVEQQARQLRLQIREYHGGEKRSMKPIIRSHCNFKIHSNKLCD
jgi:hypothetical protein